jgi:predicted RNase H-like HicB family nuclease
MDRPPPRPRRCRRSHPPPLVPPLNCSRRCHYVGRGLPPAGGGGRLCVACAAPGWTRRAGLLPGSEATHTATRTFAVLVQGEGDGWSALCPELSIASRRDTIEEARANVREAVDLFLETAGEAEVRQRLHAETHVTSPEVEVG